MYTIFLAGGIASGKSTVAQLLEEHGAWRVDLDEVSRMVCEAGSDVVAELALEFGDDIVDSETGELNRRLLAERAFATPETTRRLEEIELPAIRSRLAAILTRSSCAETTPAVCVVEVPLLDRVVDMLDLADEVVAVVAPYQLRCVRAFERGMTKEDFEARAAGQPSDEYLIEHATTVFVNEGSREELKAEVDAFWNMKVCA